jgi:pimeloyl-ACP methyl ester carboxylesterase
VTSTAADWDSTERHVTLNGERIAYHIAGSGPLLLLVHGMAGSSETWRRVMPALAGRFTVLAPDLLGQGESEKPRGDYSLGAQASMLRDLLDELGYERATVIGQSLGGGIAMQFAYQFPERCERLVLVNSGGLGREVTFYLRLLSLPGFDYVFPLFCSRPLRDAGNRVGRWLAGAGFESGAAGREIWRSYASLADSDSRRAFFRSLREVVDSGGQAVSALGRLYRAANLPTLIVWGREDPFIPVSHGIDAQKAIPGSRLEIFEDVGHYPHCEVPERFVAVLVDFIDSTKPAHLTARATPREQPPMRR